MAIINILDCGAIADGKTSCTAAIKTAVINVLKMVEVLFLFLRVHI